MLTWGLVCLPRAVMGAKVKFWYRHSLLGCQAALFSATFISGFRVLSSFLPDSVVKSVRSMNSAVGGLSDFVLTFLLKVGW